MANIIDLKNVGQNVEKTKGMDKDIVKALCDLTELIGNLTMSNISMIADYNEFILKENSNIFEEKRIIDNNKKLFEDFDEILEDFSICVFEKSYQEQIQFTCEKFPQNAQQIIMDYLQELYESKEYLTFAYLLYYIKKIQISDSPALLEDHYFSDNSGIKTLYYPIKLESYGACQAIDFDNIYLDKEKISIMNKDEITQLIYSILSHGILISKKGEVINTWPSYIQMELSKIEAEKRQRKLKKEEFYNRPLSEIQDTIAKNNFKFIDKFAIDDNNYISIYYNEKCCAFLEEVVKDGKTNINTVEGPVISYPKEDKDGNVFYNYVTLNDEVEQQILKDPERLTCIPYIRPAIIPFGFGFSAFKEFDSNYYDLDKIYKLNPNIKHMSLVEKIEVESCYNAIRFIAYAVNESKTLADIIGYENNLALDNSGLDEINYSRSATIIPFHKK